MTARANWDGTQGNAGSGCIETPALDNLSRTLKGLDLRLGAGSLRGSFRVAIRWPGEPAPVQYAFRVDGVLSQGGLKGSSSPGEERRDAGPGEWARGV
jgi:hypothetical protein